LYGGAKGIRVSFWDRIKPSARAPEAVGVTLAEGKNAVALEWDDGAKTSVSARELRINCPCAACVDEWTHQRTLKPEHIPDDIRILTCQPVGNYALQFTFSDAHQTGIFNWTLLRQLSKSQ
jgi:DUF971 family protein